MNLYAFSHTFIVLIVVRHILSDNEDCVRNVSCHRAWEFLDSLDCGISATDRIIGGVNAALGQFPWLVRVGYSLEGDDEVDWRCGAVLITDRHALTAGHCLETSEEYEISAIRIGEYDTQTDPDCQLSMCAPLVQDNRIKSILIHPKFNKPPYHNDIAIIELETPAALNDYVVPVCLPRSQQDAPNVGELVSVAGWGRTNMTTQERAKILQYVALPIVEPEVCNSFGPEFKISPSEICAGAQLNKDACVGDSGGPLMKVYDTEEGPKTFAIGVVSFGPTICGNKKPGVYTSVAQFLPWILDSIL